MEIFGQPLPSGIRSGSGFEATVQGQPVLSGKGGGNSSRAGQRIRSEW